VSGDVAWHALQKLRRVQEFEDIQERQAAAKEAFNALMAHADKIVWPHIKLITGEREPDPTVTRIPPPGAVGV
jgi:hypothetical protein